MVKKTTCFSFIILLTILIVGTYLRLWRIADYMTFLGDEGRDVLVVKRMIVDHKFTLLGPTASVGGFFLGPIYYYFMVPALWISGLNPVGPAIMVALFGVATIFLVYVLGKTFFDKKAGLIAAALFALSPVVINYSHSSWNPNIVPFFASLLVLLLYKWNEIIQQKMSSRAKSDLAWRSIQFGRLLRHYVPRNDITMLFLTGAIMGIGLQLHYLFSFLGVFSLIYLIIIRKKINWKELGIVFMGFIVLYSPFILFELRHNFTNTQMILKFVFTSSDTGFSLYNFFHNIFDIIWRLFFRLVADNNNILSIVVLLVSGLGILKTKNKLLLLWLAVPLILFGFYKKPIYDYYFGIFFPVPFLLFGWGISNLLNRKATVVVAVVIFSLLVYKNWEARPFKFEPNRQLFQTQSVAEFILEKAGGKPFNFALITGHNSDHAYRYFFEINNNPARVIENAQVDPERKTVTNQLLVICELVQCQPLGSSLWEVAGFGRGDIVGHWKVSVLDVYKLKHYN